MAANLVPAITVPNVITRSRLARAGALTRESTTGSAPCAPSRGRPPKGKPLRTAKDPPQVTRRIRGKPSATAATAASAASASTPAAPSPSRRRRRGEEKEVQLVAVKRPRVAAASVAVAAVSPPAPIVTLADLDMARVLQELSKRDSKLGLIIRKFGPPTSLMDHVSGDSFKALARGIVFQQLATRVAAKIFDRLAEACGGDAAFSPTTMKRLKEQKGRAAGLSARKFEYLQSLADAFLSGVISQEILTKLPDADCTTRLCVLRGIGEWSAHMFMMFTLARADVFPYGDFGMRKAFQRVYNCGSPGTADLPKRGEMEAIAEKWRPYRTVGSWYMWRSLETQTP